MNDLWYSQLLNPNLSLNLVLMCEGNNQKLLNIDTTLGKYLIISHSLSQSPITLRADDLIFKDFMLYPIYDILKNS